MSVLGFIYLLFFPAASFLYSIFNLWNSPSKWRKYIPFLIYIFFIGAYAFESHHENFDLIRYIPTIEDYGKLSLFEALQLHNDVLYFQHFMFWLFGYLNVPHMVPAISTATVYTIAVFITCDTAERYKKEKYIGIIILFQLAMLPYFNIVNNVRNVFALSLIVLAVYLDIVKKKRNLFVLFCYIAGCLMHLSAFVIIIFRILSRPLKSVFEIIVFLPLFFSPVVSFLYNARSSLFLMGSLGQTVNNIIVKLYGYMNNSHLPYSILTMNSPTVKFDRMVMAIGMTIALLLMWYGLRLNKQLFEDNYDIYPFLGMIAMVSLIFGFTMPMPNFWRFTAAFYTTFSIIIIPYIKQFEKLPYLLKMILPVYAILGILNFSMQLWKCTWFEFGDWIIAFLTTNLLTIAYDLFIGMF